MKITKLFTVSILWLSSLFILAWCNTNQVQQWDTITVSYDSTLLKDATSIEKWAKKTFTVWMWETFPAFDTELIDMKIWESKVFTASVEQWYGIYHDANKVQDITKAVFTKIGTEPRIWDMINLWKMEWLVLDTWAITYKIDFNEIQTREPVEFKVKITDIVKTK